MATKQGSLPLYHDITDPWSRMALGLVDGANAIHKFGSNTDVGATEEDLWLVGGKEVLPTSGTSMWIACDDNVNGVGQTIRVEGLDELWVDKVETVVLAGHTPTLIGDANSWTRINRAYQVSAEPDPVGDLWIGSDDTDFASGVPATASTVHGFVQFTNAAQQTEKAMYTVPANHAVLLHGFNAQIGTPSGAARTALVSIEVQEPAPGGGWAPWRRIDSHDLISDGDSSATEKYLIPLGPFYQKTNIHMRALASASCIIRGDMSITIYDLG
jgi:hypothetical protein